MKLFTLVLAPALLMTPGCSTQPTSQVQSDPAVSQNTQVVAEQQNNVSTKDQAKADITQVMEQAAKDWSAGELEAFMASYHKSPDLRFAHPKGITRGWQTVMDGYRKGIAASNLEYTDLDVTVLADDAAMVFGRFHNRGEQVGYQTGLFTLLFKKIDGQWKIIHDHSSDLPDGYTDDAK